MDATAWCSNTSFQLFNPANDCPAESSVDEFDEDGIVIYFNNSAARIPSIAIPSYIPGNNETILALARADA